MIIFLVIDPKDSDVYCNARFGYCVSYPPFLKAQPESANGDGRIFQNEAGETALTVYGTLNLDANGDLLTLEKQFKRDLKSLATSKSDISYQKLGKNFYVISGRKSGKIFYQKTIAKEESFCFAVLEYKQSEKVKYDSVSASIFRSFK
jgi:hypothetical protein